MNENVTLGIPYAIVYVSMQSGILWVKKMAGMLWQKSSI